jgi:hypothetical protein
MVAVCYEFPPEKGIPQTAGNLCCIEYCQPLEPGLYGVNVYATALIALAGSFTVIVPKEQRAEMLRLDEICYLASPQVIARFQPVLLDQNQRFGGFILAMKRAIDPDSFLSLAVSVAFALTSPVPMVMSHEQLKGALPLPDWQKHHLFHPHV